jgi:hypothetical protein
LADDHVGFLVVYDVEYFECEECGDYLFPPATAKKIGEARDQRISEILQSRPISEYISAAETAAILGISRQALHKHRRISRGFIYQLQFGAKTVYLKSSVLQFKETEDGRFLLCPPERPVVFQEWMGSTASQFSFLASDPEAALSQIPISDFRGAISTASARSIN